MSRGLRSLLVTLVAVGVILVAADLAARSYALTRVAEQVQREEDLPQRPTVTVARGSFLWQALRGRFDDVTITAQQVPAGKLTLSDARVLIPSVDVPTSVLLGRGGTVDLAAGTVSATAGWATLQSQLSTGSMPVTLSRDGAAVRAASQVSLFGRTLSLALDVSPEIDGDTVRLTPRSAVIGGTRVSLADARRLARLAGVTDGYEITLDGLPREVQVTALSVADTGVQVDGTLRPSAVDVPGSRT